MKIELRNFAAPLATNLEEADCTETTSAVLLLCIGTQGVDDWRYWTTISPHSFQPLLLPFVAGLSRVYRVPHCMHSLRFRLAGRIQVDSC